MKKIILSAFMLTAFGFASSAQTAAVGTVTSSTTNSSKTYNTEFKLAKSSGKLVITEVNNLEIEGTSGNEIIFTTADTGRGIPERAQGLRAVGAMGLEDNTGLGLSAVTKGDITEVQQMSKMSSTKYKILVPKGVIVSYSHNSPHGHSLKVSNLDNELEISTLHSSIKLTNVTGPMSINSIHGNIDVLFSTLNQSKPVSVASVHGHIDVSLPTNTKANFKMSTSWGEVFVDPEMKLEFDTTADKMKRYGSNDLSAKLNGGGIELNLSSTHSNIYIRKK